MTIEEIRNLIGGNSMEYGNDVDEIIIRDAEVIAVL